MAKKIVKSDFRVVVYPQRLGNLGLAHVPDNFVSSNPQKDYEERCKDIEKQIRRHVDNAGQVFIQHDTEPVCEHCGARWTEESDTYNGGCCDEDEANAPSEAAHATA